MRKIKTKESRNIISTIMFMLKLKEIKLIDIL